jgi:hypothetical protein
MVPVFYYMIMILNECISMFILVLALYPKTFLFILKIRIVVFLMLLFVQKFEFSTALKLACKIFG